MTTSDSNVKSKMSPMTKFNFQVDFGTDLAAAAFQEVSGLEPTTQSTEYHKSNTPKISRATKYSNVALKRGVITQDSVFWNWYKEPKSNNITPLTVVIKLSDENGNIVTQWQLNSAWPTKMEALGLTSEGNEIAVESLELAFETMVINGEK